MSGWRKAARKVASFIGSAVILAGASHGVISGVTREIGQPQQIPAAIINDYTGFNPVSNTFDQNQLIKSLLTIGGAVVAGKIIRWAARSV